MSTGWSRPTEYLVFVPLHIGNDGSSGLLFKLLLCSFKVNISTSGTGGSTAFRFNADLCMTSFFGEADEQESASKVQSLLRVIARSGIWGYSELGRSILISISPSPLP